MYYSCKSIEHTSDTSTLCVNNAYKVARLVSAARDRASLYEQPGMKNFQCERGFAGKREMDDGAWRDNGRICCVAQIYTTCRWRCCLHRNVM